VEDAELSIRKQCIIRYQRPWHATCLADKNRIESWGR
jgi:hypothetical protein